MPECPYLRGSLKLTQCCRKHVWWSLLIFILAICAMSYYFTRPHRLARYSAAMLERYTGARAEIDRAMLTWTGRIDLEGVRLNVPEVKSQTERLFQTDRIILKPNWWTLTTGRMQIQSMRMMRPTIYITEDYDHNLFNIQMLAQHVRKFKTTDPVEHLPELYVHHAKVVFGAVKDGHYQPLDAIGLEGEIRASDADTATYYFKFHRQNHDPAVKSAVSGQFNLRDKTFSVEIEKFHFDRSDRNFLSRQFRAWWDLLEPQGQVPHIHIAYTAEHQLIARIQLANGQINVPYENFRSRMTGVTGQFVIASDQVRVHELSGSIEGIRCLVNGRIDGLNIDAPFRFNIQTDEFVVVNDPKWVATLPTAVQVHFQRFRPSGRFAGHAMIARQARDGIQVHGTLEVIDAEAAYQLFDYRLHRLRGRIDFSNEQVDVVSLTALGPKGGQVKIAGTVSPPKRGAEVQLTVTGDDIPIDQSLLNAMAPMHRSIYQMLAHQTAYRSLVEMGVIQSSDGSEPMVPQFNLGGQINVRVDIHRPLGANRNFEITSTIKPITVGLLFEHWPYPLTIMGGQIIVAPEKTLIEDIKAVGPTGAKVAVSGTITSPHTDAPMVPSIQVHRVQMLMDQLLVASLPAPQNQWVADLNLTGDLDASGHVGVNPVTGKIGFEIETNFSSASANPFGKELLLEGIDGMCVIRSNGMTIHELVAQTRGGTLHAEGTVNWGRQLGNFDLHFKAQRITIDPALLSVIPSHNLTGVSLHELIQVYQIQGVSDASLHLVRNDGAAGNHYRATLWPHSVSFDLHNQHIQLQDMSGEMHLQPGLIDLNNLIGHNKEGSFEASGYIRHTKPRETILNFSAAVDRLGLTVRSLLPEKLLGFIDYLQLDGAFTIQSGRLVLRPDAQEHPNLEFHSGIEVQGGTATVGVPISDLYGTLDVAITTRADFPWPDVSLSLNAERVRAAKRLIEPLRLHVSTDHDTGRLKIGACRGTVYGGSFIGDGWLRLTASGDYSFDLKIHDVDVDSFVDPDHAPRKGSFDSGQLSANLLIESRYTDPHSRRGRGELIIVDASLFEEPLLLAVLQTLNFTLPLSRSFQQASARYIIAGNDVLFDDIRFTSPSIAIVGQGSMDWTDLDLDLHLVTRNPQSLFPNTFDQLLNVFKDNLINIHVSGTLPDPTARLAPFSGVRSNWRDLFGEAPSGGRLKLEPPIQPQTIEK